MLYGVGGDVSQCPVCAFSIERYAIPGHCGAIALAMRHQSSPQMSEG